MNIKVGIIGLGKMGKIHQRVLNLLKLDRKISKIYQNDVTDIPYNMPLDDILRKSDCLVVATPTPSHKLFVDKCIALSKPVFCEKPFSDGYCEDDAYYKMWSGTNNPEKRPLLFMGYIERYNAVLIKLKEIINEIKKDKYDKILYCSTRRVNSVLQDVIKGREIVTDLGVHDFDMLRILFGSVQLQSARMILSKKKAVFVQSLFLLEKGILCDSVISWIDTFKRREYIVYTEKKVITADLVTQKITIQNRLNNKADVYQMWIEPAYQEMSAFIRFVKTKKPLQISDPLGLEAQKIAMNILNNAEGIAYEK